MWAGWCGISGSEQNKEGMHMVGVKRPLDLECLNFNGRMAGAGKYKISLEVCQQLCM